MPRFQVPIGKLHTLLSAIMPMTLSPGRETYKRNRRLWRKLFLLLKVVYVWTSDGFVKKTLGFDEDEESLEEGLGVGIPSEQGEEQDRSEVAEETTTRERGPCVKGIRKVFFCFRTRRESKSALRRRVIKVRTSISCDRRQTRHTD